MRLLLPNPRDPPCPLELKERTLRLRADVPGRWSRQSNWFAGYFVIRDLTAEGNVSQDSPEAFSGRACGGLCHVVEEKEEPR